MENTACREDLQAEHGLSLWLEIGGSQILFDAGQTGAFADNAQKLGVDLAQAELAILSHGHYDHSGGLLRFLQCNETAPVYLSRRAFEPHFNASNADIGLDPALLGRDRLIFVDEELELGRGLTLYSGNGWQRPFETDPFGLTVLENGVLQPDDFRHEQYLLVEEGEKRILISGCSHKGILNLVHWFRPDVLIGGFPFMKLDPDGPGREALEQAAETLLGYNTVYYTGHCTGEAQFRFLKDRMGDRLHAISTGAVFEV